jgi:hypothetical protein
MTTTTTTTTTTMTTTMKENHRLFSDMGKRRMRVRDSFLKMRIGISVLRIVGGQQHRRIEKFDSHTASREGPSASHKRPTYSIALAELQKMG